MRVEVAQNRVDGRIERDPGFGEQAPVADHDLVAGGLAGADALGPDARTGEQRRVAYRRRAAIDRRRASAMTARASGWRLDASADAARRSTSSADRPPVTTSLVNCGVPRVSVPVLSNANVSHAARLSTAEPPLINTPCRASQAMLASIAAGVASTSPHGHATTSTATTRDQTSGQPAR